MDQLQAGVKPSLAVFPQPPVLLQPSKAALHHPTLWHDREGVHLTAFCNLHCDMFTQCVTHALRKGLAHIAAVAQHALHSCEAGCGGQVISDSLIGFFDVDSRSKALGDKLPSFECSLTLL